MSQPVSRFYTSFGLRLHYVVWGNESKPPLVLVHGKGDHARSWDFFADALGDRYSIYAPDLRGHGDSDWSAGGGYLIADYVTDLAKLIEVIDRGPVDIVSHSLGGRIAPFYAAGFPRAREAADIDRRLRRLFRAGHNERPASRLHGGRCKERGEAEARLQDAR